MTCGWEASDRRALSCDDREFDPAEKHGEERDTYLRKHSKWGVLRISLDCSDKSAEVIISLQVHRFLVDDASQIAREKLVLPQSSVLLLGPSTRNVDINSGLQDFVKPMDALVTWEPDLE